jgi:hypothetical protein
MIVVAMALGASSPADLSSALMCPERIKTRQELVSTPPDGWQSFRSERGSRIGNFGQIAGFTWNRSDPPSTLAPDHYWISPKDKRVTSAIWKFNPKHRYWAVCGYAGTEIVLMRQLPAGLTECTIKTSGPQALASASCKTSAK